MPDQSIPRGLLYVPVPVTQSIDAVADAHVQGGSAANTNYGTRTQLLVKNYKTDDFERDVYARFDLTQITAINTARLRVFGRLSGPENANVPMGVFALRERTAARGRSEEDTDPQPRGPASDCQRPGQLFGRPALTRPTCGVCST